MQGDTRGRTDGPKITRAGRTSAASAAAPPTGWNSGNKALFPQHFSASGVEQAFGISGPQTLTKTKQSHVLSESTILCWATFIAILGCMCPLAAGRKPRLMVLFGPDCRQPPRVSSAPDTALVALGTQTLSSHVAAIARFPGPALTPGDSHRDLCCPPRCALTAVQGVRPPSLHPRVPGVGKQSDFPKGAQAACSTLEWTLCPWKETPWARWDTWPSGARPRLRMQDAL